jgi:hypothetical protein
MCVGDCNDVSNCAEIIVGVTSCPFLRLCGLSLDLRHAAVDAQLCAGHEAAVFGR